MNKTKILSALLAALLLAGCGNTDVPTSSDKNGGEPSGAVLVTDSSESDSSETEKPDLDGAAGCFGTYINDRNCIITLGTVAEGCEGREDCVDDDRQDYIADKQLLYYAAERMIDQYNCIADRDLQGFFDSINYPDLYRSENAPMIWAANFLGEDFLCTENDLLWSALDYTYFLLGKDLDEANEKYSEDNSIENTDYTRDEVLADYRALMDKAAEKATLENSEGFIREKSCFDRLVRKQGSITNDEYFASPEKFRLEPSDDIIYIIDMDSSCVVNNSDDTKTDIAIRMSVTVLNGDYAIDLGDCNMWLTNNGVHLMPFPVSVRENPYKGKSMDEIKTAKNEESPDNKTPAEAALSGAYFHFNEGMYEGGDDADLSIWEKMVNYGSYALSISDEGLDVSIKLAEHENDLGIGDYEIISAMNDYGYESGTVWIRPEPDGSGDIYIIYESPDGQKEELHTDQSPWF